jgi:hypothetical protein
VASRLRFVGKPVNFVALVSPDAATDEKNSGAVKGRCGSGWGLMVFNYYIQRWTRSE